MAVSALTDLPLWSQFEEAARKHDQEPEMLLADYMRECLETWEDQQLDAEMERAAQASGYTEEDAVVLVRRSRQERQQANGST